MARGTEQTTRGRTRPARRSFAVAAVVIGLTLLLARCSPNLEAAALPNWPTYRAIGSPASSTGAAANRPSGGAPSSDEDPTLRDGAMSTGSTQREPGSPPRDGDASGGRGEETTTTTEPSTQEEVLFCRHLGEFVAPIRELGPDDARSVPKEIADEVERVHAGYRDDPDFDRHDGAEDMLAIWRWAARRCSEPMAGQPARFRLVQFEDQLAGQGPIDVCDALPDDDVAAAFAPLTTVTVKDAKPRTSRLSSQCTYTVDFGGGKTKDLSVTVDDRWGIVEGSCVGRSGAQEVDLEPAERACRTSSRPSGVWALYAEQRSRTVSIELRWPILDSKAPSDEQAQAIVADLYRSLSPSIVLGSRTPR